MSDEFKYKFVKGLVWVTMVYLLFTSVSIFYGSIISYNSSIAINELEKYFGFNIFFVVSSALLFVWSCVNIILYIKKNVFFINSFVNNCLTFGLIKSFYFPLLYFNSNSSVYFDYFLKVKSDDLLQDIIIMAVLFLIASLVRKFFVFSQNPILK